MFQKISSKNSNYNLSEIVLRAASSEKGCLQPLLFDEEEIREFKVFREIREFRAFKEIREFKVIKVFRVIVEQLM